MISTNNQNIASKNLPVNSETLKTSDITEPPVQDPLAQIRNCFEKFADALGHHMATLGNQISNNVIDAMNTSDNPRIDKEEGIKTCSHSSRAKASQEDEEESRRECQKRIINSSKNKSQIQEKRNVMEVSSSKSSENEQFSNCNGDNKVNYLSLP